MTPALDFNWPPVVKAARINGVRIYPIPGVANLVSITHMIKSTVGYSRENLIAWNVTRQLEADCDAAALEAKENGYRTKALFVEGMRKRLGPVRAGRAKMEKAGEIGTEIHDAVHRYLACELAAGGDLDESAVLGIEPRISLSAPAVIGFTAFLNWWRDAGLRPLRMEQTVWNETWNHAGTVDLFCLNEHDELEILDYKSSSGIYDEMHLQVAAYVNAALLHGLPVKRARLVRLPKSGTDLSVEVRELGDLYEGDDVAAGSRVRTWEQMMRGVEAAQGLWDLAYGSGRIVR